MLLQSTQFSRLPWQLDCNKQRNVTRSVIHKSWIVIMKCLSQLTHKLLRREHVILYFYTLSSFSLVIQYFFKGLLWERPLSAICNRIGLNAWFFMLPCVACECFLSVEHQWILTTQRMITRNLISTANCFTRECEWSWLFWFLYITAKVILWIILRHWTRIGKHASSRNSICLVRLRANLLAWDLAAFHQIRTPTLLNRWRMTL